MNVDDGCFLNLQPTKYKSLVPSVEYLRKVVGRKMKFVTINELIFLKVREEAQHHGELAERSIASVLKTEGCKSSGSSNLSLSAMNKIILKTRNCKVIWITLLTENQCDA